MKRYCLALDLIDDPILIAEYDAYHQNVWPDVIASLKATGIVYMEIYRAGNRLFLIMTTKEGFSLEKKKEMDAANPKVQEWETLMWKYQKALPVAKAGEKWALMERVFKLG